MNRTKFVLSLMALLIAFATAAGCSQSEEAASETTPAGTSAPAQTNQNAGLASPKRALKDRANAAAQSTESPVGAPKANMQ